jgi:hypothetical protein
LGLDQEGVALMFRWGPRLTFFLSSMSPLLVVFALLDTWGKGAATIICVAVAVISCLGLLVIFRSAATLAPAFLRPSATRRRDGDAIAYVVTYFVPFLTVPADTPRKAAALGILVALIGTFYIRGELYHWNPLLALLGYRVIEVDTPSGDSVSIITKRRRIQAGREFAAIPLADNIYWERKK